MDVGPSVGVTGSPLDPEIPFTAQHEGRQPGRALGRRGRREEQEARERQRLQPHVFPPTRSGSIALIPKVSRHFPPCQPPWHPSCISSNRLSRRLAQGQMFFRSRENV